MNERRNPCSDCGPVVDNKTGEDRSNQARKKSFYESYSFGYFFSMFCGCLVGSLLGTVLVKFLTQFL